MKKQPVESKQLREAFMAYNEKYLSEVTDLKQYANISIPDTLEERMRKLIRKQTKPLYKLWNTAGKRAACIFIAILIVFSSLTFSVKALREPIVEFISKTYRQFTEILFPQDVLSDNLESLSNIEPHWPSYIPLGYSLSSEEHFVLSAQRIYSDSNGMILSIEQSYSDGQKIHIDTEQAICRDVMIGNIRGIYSEKDGERTLFFTSNNQAYIISGIISETEIIRIAESIK